VIALADRKRAGYQNRAAERPARFFASEGQRAGSLAANRLAGLVENLKPFALFKAQPVPVAA
jgi:hypothetical protein